MVTLWPEVLQWSWIGKGDFWCSLNLSAKILADSPIYSSSQPSSLHLYLYMTPLLLVIGSLSFGAIRRPLMVWSPLKCTCTPYFLHVFFILSLNPCWYGTTIYKFLLLLLFWPVWLLLFLVALSDWVLAFQFCPIDGPYGVVAFLGALHRWFSSFCNSCGLEHTVLLCGTGNQPHYIWKRWCGGCPTVNTDQCVLVF